MLLNKLPVRVIVNGYSIYEVEKGKQMIITIPSNYPHIVVTNGFHYTQPVQIKYQKNSTFHLAITCAIDNDRLLAGVIVTMLFFLAGLTSGLILLRFLSFFPVLYFLYAFYINRQGFLKFQFD